MCLLQRRLVEEAGIFPVEDLGAEETPDLVIDHVTEHRRGKQNADQRPDIHAALTNCRQRAGHKKQRIAGKERENDEARLGKDDKEQDAVDPQPVLLHQNGQMLVEVQNDIEELRQEFHV